MSGKCSVQKTMQWAFTHVTGACRSPYKSASQEMQSMIEEGSDDAERFGQLVDVLLDSELPFKEASLGNGEWQVRIALFSRFLDDQLRI